MLDILKESGQPTFRGSSALNRGVLKRKGGRCTNQLTAESTDIELLFRSSNSANQLSIHGAVASWCDDLAEQILGQTHMVMEKFVSQANKQFHQTWSRKKCILSCRDRGGTMEQETACVIILNNLKNGRNEVKFTKACESAGFIRRVSKGMHYKTIYCVNGGFDVKTAACREYTVLREDPKSHIKTCIWMLHKFWYSSSSQNYMLS